MFTHLPQFTQHRLHDIVSSSIENVHNMDVFNISNLIVQYTTRCPQEIKLHTKEYLYERKKEMISYFETNVYNETFCYIYYKSPLSAEIHVNKEYATLLEECCISHINTSTDTPFLVDGDIIVDEAFDNYKYSNKLIYCDGKILDLYLELNKDGMVPPEICYPRFPLDFPESMNLNCTQWLDCNESDFREQLIQNISFEMKEIHGEVIYLCTTRIVYDDTLYFNIELSPVYWSIIDNKDKQNVISYCTAYFQEIETICFGYATEQPDSVFDVYNKLSSSVTYYGMIGGIKDGQYIQLYYL